MMMEEGLLPPDVPLTLCFLSGYDDDGDDDDDDSDDEGELHPSDTPLTLCPQWEHHLQQFLLPLSALLDCRISSWVEKLFLGGKSGQQRFSG